MSASTPAVPAEATQPGLSQAARIINTFVSPSKTFEDVKRSGSWWAPWLFASVFLIILGIVAIQKLDMASIARHQIEQSKLAQRIFDQASPEQQEQQLRVGAIRLKAQFFVKPVLGLIGAVIIGAIFMVIFNFGFSAEVSFQRAMAIVIYAWLPQVVSSILVTLSLLASSDLSNFNLVNPVATNPAFFMDIQQAKFLYGMALGLDVINIWVVVLLGIGFAVNAVKGKLSKGTAIATVAVVYGLWIIAGAGLLAAV